MFRDLKFGGYNFEETQVTGDRLIGLLVLMTLAYSMTAIEGKTLKNTCSLPCHTLRCCALSFTTQSRNPQRNTQTSKR